jgi:hypothetical protein
MPKLVYRGVEMEYTEEFKKDLSDIYGIDIETFAHTAIDFEQDKQTPSKRMFIEISRNIDSGTYGVGLKAKFVHIDYGKLV